MAYGSLLSCEEQYFGIHSRGQVTYLEVTPCGLAIAIAYLQKGVTAGIPYSGAFEPYLYFRSYRVLSVKPFFINGNGNGARLISGLHIYFLIEIPPFIAGDYIAFEGIVLLIGSKGGSRLCSKGFIAYGTSTESLGLGHLLSGKGCRIGSIKT